MPSALEASGWAIVEDEVKRCLETDWVIAAPLGNAKIAIK
jgi:hypothetical protein